MSPSLHHAGSFVVARGLSSCDVGSVVEVRWFQSSQASVVVEHRLPSGGARALELKGSIDGVCGLSCSPECGILVP